MHGMPDARRYDVMALAGELAADRTNPAWTTFSLDLNEEQEQMRAWAHDFAANVLRPAGAEWDEREQTPWPVIEEARAVGLYSLEALIGLFIDPSGLLLPIVNEEIFWGDAGLGMALFGTTLASSVIFLTGTPDQWTTWLPRCYENRDGIAVAAFCSSEPESGSDVSAIKTRAEYQQASDEWVITGQKAWVTNGGIADLHIVNATVDPSLGSRGHAAFVVPRSEVDGLTASKRLRKHGLRASHTADVAFSRVRIPGANLLGGKEQLDERLARAREGSSSKGNASLAAYELSRHVVGSQALGIARAAYEVSLDYAKMRQQFGRPIIDNQGIAFKLADMKTEIDAARLLVWRAGWMAAGSMRGAPIDFANGEGSMAKLKASEVGVRVTEQAMQILGGNGYSRELPVERWHRDARVFTIFEGTSEIQRLVIARAISGIRIR